MKRRSFLAMIAAIVPAWLVRSRASDFVEPRVRERPNGRFIDLRRSFKSVKVVSGPFENIPVECRTGKCGHPSCIVGGDGRESGVWVHYKAAVSDDDERARNTNWNGWWWTAENFPDKGLGGQGLLDASTESEAIKESLLRVVELLYKGLRLEPDPSNNSPGMPGRRLSILK